MASKNPPQTDAIELLEQDHAMVEDLFDEFKRFQAEETQGVDELKQELMDEVCRALTIHAQIEEEIFYPAVREALPDEEDLLNEALVEHAGAKDLIAQVQAGSASDPMTCARFLVLAEQIEHHVEEEEDEMFPKIQDSDMDTKEIGRRLAERKRQLEGEELKASGRKPPTTSLLERIASLGR